MLLDRRANIDAGTGDKHAALDWASDGGCGPVAATLRNHGMAPNLELHLRQ
jgi:hypothetical protein